MNRSPIFTFVQKEIIMQTGIPQLGDRFKSGSAILDKAAFEMLQRFTESAKDFEVSYQMIDSIFDFMVSPFGRPVTTSFIHFENFLKTSGATFLKKPETESYIIRPVRL